MLPNQILVISWYQVKRGILFTESQISMFIRCILKQCRLCYTYDNRFWNIFETVAIEHYFLQAYLSTFGNFLFKSHLSSSVNNIITYTWYSLYGMIEKLKRSNVVMHEVLYNMYDQNIFSKPYLTFDFELVVWEWCTSV